MLHPARTSDFPDMGPFAPPPAVTVYSEDVAGSIESTDSADLFRFVRFLMSRLSRGRKSPTPAPQQGSRRRSLRRALVPRCPIDIVTQKREGLSTSTLYGTISEIADAHPRTAGNTEPLGSVTKSAGRRCLTSTNDPRAGRWPQLPANRRHCALALRLES